MTKDPESTCSNPTKKRRCTKEERSMSDINACQIEHDVFISFRGKDVRDNFLSHLVKAFDGKKIKTSVDDTFKRGEKIWSEIVKAIEGSSISLIIFSENYATSTWCLNELVHILECRKKYKLIAIPVFYRVDPADVKHQTGTYQKAFDELGKNNDSTMVQSWRDALSESTGLTGINSSKFGNDAVLIDEIVSHVLRELSSSNNSVNSSGLFGIEKQIEAVKSLLDKRIEGTHFIGIWGIGGIGKTTIADAIFNKLGSEYGGRCFLPNVREESKRHGKVFLKEKLFTKLLGEKVELDTPNGLPDHVKRRVKHMKVLIVLDDVDDSEQLEILDGNFDWFQSGSIVIITTRNRQVVPVEDDYIHEVKALDFHDALDLFNLHAFKRSRYIKEDYCELSEKVVKYADGIPLVLKVLGGLLHGKDIKTWGSQLNDLEKNPLEKVYNSLKLSYDDLDPKRQKIFLDLACFLVGLDLKVEYIEALLKEGENDNSVAVGLESLKDRALITFSKFDGVSMHDIIQEMAWQIVSRECHEDPGRRIRLWDPNDIDQVLQNDKGSEAIKSIKVPRTVVWKLKLSPHIFAKMSKLQFLHIGKRTFFSSHGKMNHLPQGLQSLPTELRYLVWWHYPLKSLPEKFSAEKLVILDLSYSKLEKLWQGVQNLVNLKEVELQNSSKLKELPDFSKATNLELLSTFRCGELTLHPSIFSLEKLVTLDLSYSKVEKFWQGVQNLVNLKEVRLSSSEFLKELPDFSKATNLEVLDASFCDQLTNVHPSIFSLEKLHDLNLSDCESLSGLPTEIHLRSLSHLDLHGSENTSEFSVTISENMMVLDLAGTRVIALAAPFGSQSKLEKLCLHGCYYIESLPSCLNKCTKLTELDITGCRKLKTLPELPSSLAILDAEGCTSLETISFSSRVEHIRENRKMVDFWNCLKLDERSLVAIGLNAQINMMEFVCKRLPPHDDSFDNFQALYKYPGSSVPEWFVYETTEDYIVIDLSAPNSPILGFIFCFVLGKFPSSGWLKFNITICDDEGEGKGCHTVERYFLESDIDHVCVVYDQILSRFLISRARNLRKLKIKVAMKDNHSYISVETTMRIRGFGVCPINTTSYDDIIQKIE